MSSVMLAELCPSICWTTLTSAALARLAAVCRSWCGCRSGTPIALAAALNDVRNVLTRSGWPFRMPAKTRSSGCLPLMCSANAYTVRQAAYDLRKLRGKQLVVKPGRARRYLVPQPAARTIAALLAVRDHVIAPILAGVQVPRQGRPPKHLTAVDRDYEHLRVGMCSLFAHLGVNTEQAAA